LGIPVEPMSDLLCPRCRRGLVALPTCGSSVDYECENCGLAFGISGVVEPSNTAPAANCCETR